MSAERWEIHFSGRVQGVGFRYMVRQIAGRFAVAGFVQNLRDGRVLLVSEGEPAVLTSFVEAVDGEMDRYVQHREVSKRPATGEFKEFAIQR